MNVSSQVTLDTQQQNDQLNIVIQHLMENQLNYRLNVINHLNAINSTLINKKY